MSVGNVCRLHNADFSLTNIDYRCLSYRHFHLIPRVNRKHANLSVIQANMSDILANRSDIWAYMWQSTVSEQMSDNVKKTLLHRLFQCCKILKSIISLSFLFRCPILAILLRSTTITQSVVLHKRLVSCPISIGQCRSVKNDDRARREQRPVSSSRTSISAF